jgi:glycyl-tRNA synthetase
MLNFQELLSTLIQFWSSQGCIVHQPYELETGAGTFNPATFLRVLGPEPYSTVYVEPSRRPQDGRYGDNPNRTQLFHQLQVIIKPSPSDIQQKYLKSLEVIGFDLSKHDIRFVHDDWEGPTLGASGLGWEVWIDGMEITQFTYFQNVAGMPLSPIAVEITYGVERLAMILQKKDSFFDLMYNNELTYGDVFHRNEVEYSTYNFEKSSKEMWLQHFHDFEKEAKRVAEENLPIPAYDFVIKASHAFNMAEARGAFSTTERMRNILRIREISSFVAAKYLAMRERLGFPLLKYLPKKEEVKQITPSFNTSFDPHHTEDFLFEIGSEQLPAHYIEPASLQLEQKLSKLLSDHGLSYESIKRYSTPQRLAVIVTKLCAGAPEESIERKGPPISATFDGAGNLTAQGKGFFNSLGLKETTLKSIQEGSQKEMSIQNIKGVDYLFVKIHKPKVSTLSILHENLPTLIKKMTFEKTMRWGMLDISFARPISWLVALYGKEVVPFHLGNISSGRITMGHAQRAYKPISLSSPSDYIKALKDHFVIACLSDRKQIILEQLEAIEKKHGVKAVKKERVLAEVVNLTEWPELATIEFNSKFLEAPKELLVSEMTEHQRYFPLEDASQNLVNMCVITADNTVNSEIKSNNCRVLSARLTDGVFLYKLDLKKNLEDFNAILKNVTFQEKLGSIYQKMERTKAVALEIGKDLKIGKSALIERAATLSKSDLSSELVQEFPELQGIIGSHYALKQNEDKEVALAIKEHWMPISEHGSLPVSTTGAILSIADKLDSILGYFSIGLKPSSSSDPFALRRQTLGVIKILIDQKWSLNLETTLAKAYAKSHLGDSGEAIIEEILQFFKNRLKTVFEDFQLDRSLIEASLSHAVNNPYDEFCKITALCQFKSTGSFSPLLEVYKRARGQIEKETKQTVDPTKFSAASEKMLHQTLTSLKTSFHEALLSRQYESCFKLLSELQEPLANLFEEVKILSDNANERRNRIGLLQEVFGLFSCVMDFNKVVDR